MFDAASYNYRAIIPQDAVFDRLPTSHALSLFNMDRQFGDVMTSEQVVTHLNGRTPSD